MICSWASCGRQATKRIGYVDEPEVVVCCNEHAAIELPEGFEISDVTDEHDVSYVSN